MDVTAKKHNPHLLPQNTDGRKKSRAQVAERRQMDKGDGKNNKKMVISWWNGGGKLIARLKVNPVLREFLQTRPDIFAYGESGKTERLKE